MPARGWSRRTCSRPSRLQSIRLRWQVRANARRAAVVITDSEHSKRDIRHAYGIAEDRIDVVPLAADPALTPRPDAGAFDAVRRKFAIKVIRTFKAASRQRKRCFAKPLDFSALRGESEQGF